MGVIADRVATEPCETPLVSVCDGNLRCGIGMRLARLGIGVSLARPLVSAM